MTHSNAGNRHTLAAKALTLVLAAGVAVLVIPYVPGLIGAAVVYVVALPVVSRLDRSRRRRAAPIVTMMGIFVVLILPGLWLMAELLAQIPEATRTVQHSHTVARLMALQVGDLNVGSLLRQASSEIIGWSSRQTMTAVAGVVNATINLMIALFGAYYLLTSAEDLWERFKAALPFSPATSELLRTRFHRVTEAMLIGVVLTCVTQGALVGASFAALDLPQPLLWGAVTAIAAMLPLFGSALVWGPAVLILAAQDRMPQAVMLLALGVLLISNIDNALRLVVYRHVSQVHPMITLVGAFAGVRAFGLAGLLLGPLVLAYMLELLRIYRADGALVIEPAEA